MQTTQIEQDVDPETSESASKEGAENQSTLSAGQDVGTETGVVVQPISVGSLSSDELEAVAGCLEEINNILENAPHLIVSKGHGAAFICVLNGRCKIDGQWGAVGPSWFQILIVAHIDNVFQFVQS